MYWHSKAKIVRKMDETFAPKQCKRFLWQCATSICDDIFILNNKFSLNILSSPASQQGSGCRTSQRSLLSSAEETRLSTSNLGRGAHLTLAKITNL